MKKILENLKLLKLIKDKRVDIFYDIFESDNYDEYCDYFNYSCEHENYDFRTFKVKLTREEFEALEDWLNQKYFEYK